MKPKMSLEECLTCIYTDLKMLQDGSWNPDWHTVEATLTMLENVVKHLHSDNIINPEYELLDDREATNVS